MTGTVAERGPGREHHLSNVAEATTNRARHGSPFEPSRRQILNSLLELTMLIEALRRSGLLASPGAIAALEEGWTVTADSDLLVTEDLATTYELRARHLSRMPSRHATQLCASVVEFAANLRGALGRRGSFKIIKGNAEHEYTTFQLTDDNVVLGCMRTVAMSSVTREHWLELWESSPTDLIDYKALGLPSPFEKG